MEKEVIKPSVYSFNQDLLNIHYVPVSHIDSGSEVLDRQ